MKKVVHNLFLMIEFFKIELFSKVFGSHYVVKSLYLCKSDNIKRILQKHNGFIGNNISIKPMLNIDNFGKFGEEFTNISIGDNCYIGKNVFLDLANEIIIENDAVISAGVSIITHADVGERKMQKYYKRVSAPVKIGEASWIGANVTILAGVTVGKYCVVAAGSVVVNDIPDYTMVAGVPAKIKKKIVPNEED